MATSFRSVLWEVALDQQGFVTSQDARRLGIPVIELGKLASRGKLEHVSYGIYRFPELPVTPLSSYMEATLWPGGRGVLSHDTALELYELCDINPTRLVRLFHLDDQRRVGGSSKPFRSYLDPPRLALLGIENISIHVGGRIEPSGDVSREHDGLRGCVLLFGDRRVRGQPGRGT